VRWRILNLVPSFLRVRGDVDEFAKVEAMPKMEGRQMIMVLGPK